MPGPLESHWGSHRKRVGCWKFNHRALAAQRSCARLGSKPCPAEEVGWDGCSQPLGLLSTLRGLPTWCLMSAGCSDVGRRSSLAADPLLSGFPTLPRPEVELLARWCRLQNLAIRVCPAPERPRPLVTTVKRYAPSRRRRSTWRREPNDMCTTNLGPQSILLFGVTQVQVDDWCTCLLSRRLIINPQNLKPQLSHFGREAGGSTEEFQKRRFVQTCLRAHNARGAIIWTPDTSSRITQGN